MTRLTDCNNVGCNVEVNRDASPKRLLTINALHGTISQKTEIFNSYYAP
jgi:hypothetical protein